MVSEYKCGICSQKLLYDKYVERYDSDKFLCDICLRSHHISSGIYYCQHCKFDVCNNCPDFLNLDKHRICRKCNNKLYHLHSLTDPITGKYTCFKCENEYMDVDGVYSCENCEFLLCPSCEKETRKKRLFEQLKVNSRHQTPQKEALSSSPTKNPNKFIDKIKKGGLNIQNIEEKFITDNDPITFKYKEEDFMTFSGKRSPINQDIPITTDNAAKPLQQEPFNFDIVPSNYINLPEEGSKTPCITIHEEWKSLPIPANNPLKASNIVMHNQLKTSNIVIYDQQLKTSQEVMHDQLKTSNIVGMNEEKVKKPEYENIALYSEPIPLDYRPQVYKI